MLRRDEQLPFVRRVLEVRPRVAREVPEDVLLEVCLRVRRIHPAQAVEARQERPRRVGGSMVDAAVPSATGALVRPVGGDAVDELAERAHSGLAECHVDPSYKKRETTGAPALSAPAGPRDRCPTRRRAARAAVRATGSNATARATSR